jgi:hypothetical protein
MKYKLEMSGKAERTVMCQLNVQWNFSKHYLISKK